MKVLIEIKNGIVSACFSNNKDVQVQVLEHDKNVSYAPELSEYEAEHLSIKELNRKVSDAQEIEETNLFEDFND